MRQFQKQYVAKEFSIDKHTQSVDVSEWNKRILFYLRMSLSAFWCYCDKWWPHPFTQYIHAMEETKMLAIYCKFQAFLFLSRNWWLFNESECYITAETAMATAYYNMSCDWRSRNWKVFLRSIVLFYFNKNNRTALDINTFRNDHGKNSYDHISFLFLSSNFATKYWINHRISILCKCCYK